MLLNIALSDAKYSNLLNYILQVWLYCTSKSGSFIINVATVGSCEEHCSL